MKAKKANKLARKQLDNLFMSSIKTVSKNGYFSITRAFDYVTEETRNTIKRHYEKSGYKVDLIEKETCVYSTHTVKHWEIKISWEEVK